jgi:hypothetical protein
MADGIKVIDVLYPEPRGSRYVLMPCGTKTLIPNKLSAIIY